MVALKLIVVRTVISPLAQCYNYYYYSPLAHGEKCYYYGSPLAHNENCYYCSPFANDDNRYYCYCSPLAQCDKTTIIIIAL